MDKSSALEMVRALLPGYLDEKNKISKGALAMQLLEIILPNDLLGLNTPAHGNSQSQRRQRIPSGQPVFIEKVECVDIADGIMYVLVQQKEYKLPMKFVFLDGSDVRQRGDCGRLCVEKWIAVDRGLISA